MSDAIISYDDLTSYGSGKFTKEIDQIPYVLGGNGFCRWVGEAEYTGNYTFVDVDFIELPSDVAELAATMDPDDLAFLRAQYGAIVYENNYGSVGVTYYTDKESFEKAVDEAEAEIEAAYEGVEDWEEEEEEEEEEDDNTVTITGPRFLDPHDPRRPYSEDDEEEDGDDE